MSTTVTLPQPLTGTEIKRGIAVRMTQGLPPDVAETLQKRVMAGLDKTCALQPHFAYSKFKASWWMTWWTEGGVAYARWWVNYDLDNFGRMTSGGMGEPYDHVPSETVITLRGEIEEMPPDRFRRETEQPIPKPTELKPQEQDRSTFSKSARTSRKRRDV